MSASGWASALRVTSLNQGWWKAESGEHQSEISDFKSPLCDLLKTENRTLKTLGEAEMTANHPFWSVDRGEYVQPGSLGICERLQTLHGDSKAVVAIQKLPRPGPQPVFNLEVYDEHVYFVGHDGYLVHNSGNERYADVDPGAPFGRKMDTAQKQSQYRRSILMLLRIPLFGLLLKSKQQKSLKHIGRGRAAGVGDLADMHIATDGGLKSARRMDASFQDPASGRIIHFQVGQKNLRGDPVIREREALLDVIRRNSGFKSEFILKFREYSP